MIQIYFLKRNFDTQKAERFFRERGVPVQLVDLSRARLGRRELESVRQRVGMDALIDTESRAWKECPARFSPDEGARLDALSQRPQCLRLPIVRDGKRATVGYRPEEWLTWIQEPS